MICKKTFGRLKNAGFAALGVSFFRAAAANRLGSRNLHREALDTQTQSIWVATGT
jgi:hypothetical protein